MGTISAPHQRQYRPRTGANKVASGGGLRLTDARKLILNALIAEIDAVTSFRADLNGDTRGNPVIDPVKPLSQRNKVLEGLVAALNEKALAISSEYADFAAEANALLISASD